MNTAWTAASEELYKATGGAGGPQAGPTDGNGAGPGAQGAGNTGENVTDAEFEEVK